MTSIASPFDFNTSILRPPTENTRFAIVAMNIYAGDRSFNVELQRGNGASGAFETIAIIRGYLFNSRKIYNYLDTDLPSGTGFFRYRARHVRNDAIPSPYSTPVIALATLVESIQEEIFNEDIIVVEGSAFELTDYTPFGGDGEFFV